MLDELYNLAFCNAANLIQVQAALTFVLFSVHSGANEGVGNHGDRGDCGANESERELPIGQ
jgi:hypothetical protein